MLPQGHKTIHIEIEKFSTRSREKSLERKIILAAQDMLNFKEHITHRHFQNMRDKFQVS